MTGIEEKFNPWQANFLDDFLFYCCPECDFKHDAKSSFVSHALIQHPLSRAIVPTLKSKVSNCDTNVTSDQSEQIPLTIKLQKPYKLFQPQSDINDIHDTNVTSDQSELNPVNDISDTIEIKAELEDIKEEQDDSEPMYYDETLEGDEYSDYEDEYNDNESDFDESLDNVVKQEPEEEDDDCTSTYHPGKQKNQVLSKFRTIKCPICDVYFDTLQKHGIHADETHKVDDGYQCEQCDLIIEKKKDWYGHLRYKHAKPGTNPKPIPSKQKTHIPKSSTKVPKKTKIHLPKIRTIKCSICDIHFDTLQIHGIHADEIHKVDGGYQCKECDIVIEDKKSWFGHLRIKHARQPKYNHCTVCDIWFVTTAQKNKHTEEVHKVPGGYACKCGKILDTRNKWTQHLKSKHSQHRSDKDCWKCHECDTVFDTNSKLSYHKYTVHDGPKTCDKCGKECSSQPDLAIHMKRVHHAYQISEEQKVKKCDQCDTEFKISKDFDDHLKSVHKCDKAFKCKECDLTWVSHLSLELHYIESHKKIMFCCDTCGYTTFQDSILQRHRRITHEGKRDYVCHICGKSFSKKFMLPDHMAIEHDIGECRFKCDYCGKGFMNQSRKRNHVEGVHEKNKTYFCDVCNYVGPTLVALGKHKRKIHRLKRS